jgi:futalosine hydrolase
VLTICFPTALEAGNLSESPLPGSRTLITGIGPLATAFNLGRNLPAGTTALLMAGVGGSFNLRTLPLLAAAFITSEFFLDIGLADDAEGFWGLEAIGFPQAILPSGPVFNQISSPFDPPAIAGIETAMGFTSGLILHGKKGLHQRKIVFDQLSGTNNMEKAKAVESMEGFAFFLAAAQMELPFYQFRVISNEVGEGDKSRWKIREAISSLHQFLPAIAEALILQGK